jgi:hypothetical protein
MSLLDLVYGDGVPSVSRTWSATDRHGLSPSGKSTSVAGGIDSVVEAVEGL